MKRLMFLMMALTMMTGCDAAEELLDGEEAELREQEMPNCSRIITCCDNLRDKGIAPDSCEMIFKPAANTVIDTYQDARGVIPSERQADRDALRQETQDRVEPGCRCFLEETAGQIDELLLPIDCESDKTVGSLEDGAMCSEATDALISAADGASDE